MHDHDLDLIAALAEGSLGDEAEARSLVESCEVCRAEYEAHTEVLARITAAPRPEMTDLEKAALHRDLWTELRREPQTAGSVPWWQRLTYAAAALFVVVGLVAVLDRGGGDGEDAQLLAIDTTVADQLEEAPFVAEDRGAGADEGAAPESGSATSTTAAAEEAAPLRFAEMAERAREQSDPGLGTMSLDPELEGCLEELGLDDQEVAEDVDLDQRYVAVMPGDGTDQTVTIVSVDNCEIVYTDS